MGFIDDVKVVNEEISLHRRWTLLQMMLKTSDAGVTISLRTGGQGQLTPSLAQTPFPHTNIQGLQSHLTQKEPLLRKN